MDIHNQKKNTPINDSNKLDNSMFECRNSLNKQLNKKYVPKLNLTILPNYHGKTNGKSNLFYIM